MEALKFYPKEMMQYYLDSVEDIYELIELTEICYNKKNYGYSLTDKELDFNINLFLDLKRNYTMLKYGEIDLDIVINYELKKDSQGKKYFIINYDMLLEWLDVEIREYLVKRSEVNLEEIVKLNLIKNTPNIATKMKLLNPIIYNNVRAFYLSFES